MVALDRDPFARLFGRSHMFLAQLLLNLGGLVVTLAWFQPGTDRDRDRRVLMVLLVLLVGAFVKLFEFERRSLRIGVAWLVSLGFGWATTRWGSRGSYALLFLPPAGLGPAVAAIAVARALAVSPLIGLIRGSLLLPSFAADDALDRVLSRGSLWLSAALFEVGLVAVGTRLGNPRFAGIASWVVGLEGGIFGVALAITALLTLATAFSGLLRALRWQRLWGRVVRGEGLRLVDAADAEGPMPFAMWFGDFGPITRAVVCEGESEPQAYRETPVSRTTLALVPDDASLVARGLRRRLLGAGASVVLAGLAIAMVAGCW